MAFVVLYGLLLLITGAILMIFEAFRESFQWGLGTIVFPAVLYAFAYRHWNKTKKGFLLHIAGFFVLFIGPVLIVTLNLIGHWVVLV